VTKIWTRILAVFDEIYQILFLLAVTNTVTCQKQKPSFKVKFHLRSG